MTYFVNHLSLYSPKNRACKKLLDFISQFEHVLIKDDCSLDALSSLIEDRIREINTSHPKLRPICYSRNHSLQRITASVLPASGVPDYVFIMDFCQVCSIFQYSEKASVVPGVCRVCGCTENGPCYHPEHNRTGFHTTLRFYKGRYNLRHSPDTCDRRSPHAGNYIRIWSRNPYRNL